MKAIPRFVFLAVIAACSAQAAIVWDYSPSGLTLTSGYWSNRTYLLNLADLVSFPAGATITGYDHYTAVDFVGAADYRLKLLSDNAGTPGALLQEIDLVPDSFILDGTYFAGGFDGIFEDIYRASFTFAPIVLAPGVSYWIGVSGVSFDVGQAGVLTPGNGQMAQFDGPAFSFMRSVTGDQSFRLLGQLGDPAPGVPEPATVVLLAGAFAALTLVRRRLI